MDTTELFAAARWWLVLMVLGAAATPLTAYLLHRLPDRGYAFTKMIGLLLVSYLFWLLGSLGFLSNTTGSILLALLIVAGLSALALRQMDEPLTPWLKANSRQILTTELLFLLLFALWVWARAQNPTILYTEKPMEFAFLNSVGRSPQFPPLDPWLSGYSISYYYFGYVMISVLARLSAVAEPIAFNLGVAWLVAGAGVGAFGLVYNLIASHKEALRRKAVGFALVAALAIPLAGNGQMLLELLHASGVGSAEFWAWLDVRDINGPAVATETPRYETSDWWWWRSSRVIHEYTLSGRAEEQLEPIAEFPGFSFMLGDMHPHVLALPFAFVSLALALAWWLKPGLHGKEWDEMDGRGRSQYLFRHINPVFWLFTVIVLGGLSFLNTWDVLIHLFVVIAAFALAQWRDNGWHSRILGQTLILAVSFVGAAILFYLPFYLGFRSQAGAPFILPMLMRPTRLAHFLIIFGLPLLVIVVFLLSLIIKQKQRAWKIAFYAGGGLVGGLIGLMLLMGLLIASSPDGASMVINLSKDLARPLTPLLPDVTWFGRLSWALGAVANIVPAVIGARLASPGVTLLLGTIIGLVVMWYAGMFEQEEAAGGEQLAVSSEQLAVSSEQLAVSSEQLAVSGEQLAVTGDQLAVSSDESPVSSLPVSQSPNLLTLYPALPFVLLLVVTGALLTLGPEYVYLKDNFGQRLNTIFKFYYQAWVMLGAAALVALYYLLEEEKWAGYVTGTVYAVGLAAALLFPFYAVQSRGLEYRGAPDNEFRRPATLNGLAHIQNDHPDEYAAIMWLRENVSGTPVLVEAVGGAYSPNYSRVSAETGIPAVLGWANHEYQWRGTTSEPAEREQAIAQIYNNTDWLTVSELLMKYDVEYVYVGRTEQADYAPEGLAKFAQYMDVAYQNNSVVIYHWQPN